MHNTWLVMVLLLLVMLASADIMRRAVGQIVQSRRSRRLSGVMRRLRRPVQPWVTVIVYGKKNEAEREAMVRSLRRSRYYAYDVVFVGPRAKTFNTAYRKSKRGKIVICLPAGSIVDPSFIKRAVASRQNQRQWNVAVQPKQVRADSIIGITHQLRDVLWSRSVVIEACSAAALRQKKIPNSHIQLSKLIPAAIQTVTVLIIATAVVYEGLEALWYSWLLVTVYLLALIWLRYGVAATERWKLTYAVPSALFLLPVSSVIEGSLQLYTRK